MGEQALWGSVVAALVLVGGLWGATRVRRARGQVRRVEESADHTNEPQVELECAEASAISVLSRTSNQSSDQAESGVSYRPTSSTPPVLDPEIAASIRQLGGAVLGRALDAFADDAPERIAQMQKALAVGDFQLLDEAAHALKGSSGMLGGARLAALCDCIMQAARTHELDEARVYSAQLTAQVAELNGALRELVRDMHVQRRAGSA